MTETSKEDFITYWSKNVANEFGLDAITLEAALHDSKTDSDLRDMWKYAAGKGVNGTPMAFINGVFLDSVPTTVEGWMILLKKTYHS